MGERLSARLRRVVDALPLEPGIRVLEIGGAPGAAARAVAEIVGESGHVLVLDRSAKGVALTETHCADEIERGVLSVLCAEVESFALPPGSERFDVAFACRVGVLDGRHPDRYEAALARIAEALSPQGRLFVDTGDPLDEVPLAHSRARPSGRSQRDRPAGPVT
ncbi:methyltransferase domain-containing protein [Microbacterium sp. DT81.1]|uniref:methyltransferase domain-containing protein n=1 Tax=Microbacterium sp. DT81.1 TaxID=3393413 RepID=UPI003CEB15F5